MWSSDVQDRAAVVVVGSINHDTSTRVQTLPAAGETVLALSVSKGLGGKGANQAVAAAKAGARVRLIGSVGTDAAGGELLERLAAYGVDVDRVASVAGASTGAAFITVDGGGENVIAVHPAANGLLSAESVRAALAGTDTPAVVLCQGEIPAETIDASARLAVELGSRFVLNLAPVVDVAPTTLAMADPLIVNEGEAQELARRLSLDLPPGSSIDVLVEVLAGVASSVVITLGAKGAVLAGRRGGAQFQPAFPSQALDTTGAGDSFAGVLAAGLATGAGLAESVRRGAAAAALSVQRHGAAESYASEHIIQLLLDANRLP